MLSLSDFSDLSSSGLATAVAGSYVGRKIITIIDQDKFKKIVLIAIILASIKFIVDGITDYWLSFQY